MTKFLLAALAVLFAVAVNAQPASAQTRERIVSFDSEIWVQDDASMTVRETITVDSTRRKIRRGIFREFPTKYRDLSGNRFVVGFEVQEVLRNGKREPYRIERLSNGIRIRIGDADVLIPKGRHVYRITYRTDRQLGFFDDFDELFWNVTGNGWDFPIERARATVHLPDGARVLNRAGYTGRAGERGRDFTYTAQNDETFSVETSRTLKPGEGLTIAVSWPRGFIQRPSNEQRLGYVLRDNSGVLAGVFGLAILFAYYLIAWAKVGRDPETGPIFPLYAPPKGVSPAGARYVTRMGFDDKTFTAAIVSMAVKGYLTIEEEKKKTYTLELTGQSAGLSKGESALARKLFSISRLKIELKQKNHETLQAAKKALQQSLRTEFEKIYFVRNTGYFAPGIGLTVLALIALVAAADHPFEAAFASVWLTIWTGVVYYLGLRAWRGWQAVIAGGGSITRFEAIVMTLFSLPFFGGEVMGLAFYAESTSIGAAVIVVLMQLSNLVFYHLLKAPTRLGRRAMDGIEGFRDYLSVAEKDRMNLLNPPDRTPELFEQFLPYALALGVEQQWSEQFSDVLAQAGSDPAAGGRHYSPRWYSGRSLDSGFSDFASSLGGGFAGAVSSASTAPGSSSGSGGGGSSGGGGGGGGGGGW
ncbi:MAG: DUF2207 domain-containing protein [Alphaproteobacteria bacterium]|nr:DUF2207 domain-containing protein [Alphaproteobacteria bacterium]